MNNFICKCDSGLPNNYDYGCALGACDYCRESDKCGNCLHVNSYGKEDSECNNCCYKDYYLSLKPTKNREGNTSNLVETKFFDEDPF